MFSAAKMHPQLDSPNLVIISAGLFVFKNVNANFAACGLHIAFHGCNQGKTFVGDAYVKQTNYNQVADANNFIILYPQVQRFMLGNTTFCIASYLKCIHKAWQYTALHI